MSRLEIRGIIVGSEYDNDWMQEYIERGILTPESRFRAQLSAAPDNEPLTVYLNTPGGSVFAGNEMVNAVMAWKQATGQKVNIEIGAMAASMGASFTIQTADAVKVHANSLMMFHGAWGVQIGGEQAMQDYSTLLGKVNARDKTTLLTRYELQPEQVDTWFAEGREGWLDAAEMKAAGIAQEIVGEDADALDMSDIDVDAFAAHGLKIAALVTGLAELAAEGGSDEGDDAGGGAAVGGDGDAGGNAPGNAGDGDPASAIEAARTDAHASGRAEAVAEYAGRVAEMQKKIDGLNKALATTQSERDQARNEIDRMKADHETKAAELSEQLRAANERTEQLLDGSLNFSAGVTTWAEALEACGGDYVEAAKQYPELRDKYNQEHKTGLKG